MDEQLLYTHDSQNLFQNWYVYQSVAAIMMNTTPNCYTKLSHIDGLVTVTRRMDRVVRLVQGTKRGGSNHKGSIKKTIRTSFLRFFSSPLHRQSSSIINEKHSKRCPMPQDGGRRQGYFIPSAIVILKYFVVVCKK